MTQMHDVVGEILNSDENRREMILNSIVNINFCGDSFTVIEAIKSLPADFSFVELAAKFEAKDRTRLISLCMEANIKEINKEIIQDIRKTGGLEYISIFKR